MKQKDYVTSVIISSWTSQIDFKWSVKWSMLRDADSPNHMREKPQISTSTNHRRIRDVIINFVFKHVCRHHFR